MFLTEESLPRRTFLRGMGAAIGLPLLDAMVPAATALAATPAVTPRRFGFMYIPHGADMGSWTPTAAGSGFALSPTLEILDRFKDEMVVVTNLMRAGGLAEMHAAAASGWLSGAIPKRTEGQELSRRHHDRSGAGASARRRFAVPVARVRHRGLHRLRGRLRRPATAAPT